MSITGKQFLVALQAAAQGSSAAPAAPTTTFVSSIDTYPTTAIPSSFTLSGVITANTAVVTSWTITANGVQLAAGSSLTPSVVVSSPPNSTTIYELSVSYTLNNVPNILTASTSVAVTGDAALYGNLLAAGDDLTVPSDLTPALEATFTEANIADISSVFSITTTVVAKLVMVIPVSFGNFDIQDENGISVLPQFNIISDSANSRVIAVTNNPVIPNTFQFQISFL
jgi:hypothetical protein